MKVYYLTVMAVGIMFLFYVAGIETNSSNIISAIGNPTNWSSGTIWVLAIAAMSAFLLLTNKISAFGFTVQASTEAIIAVFVGGIYIIFAADLYSIVTFVGSITDSSTNWIYYLVWSLIVPLMIGYTISLIDYIRGSD